MISVCPGIFVKFFVVATDTEIKAAKSGTSMKEVYLGL